ncbi:MAG TPA: hypothetical protein DCY07_06180 [Rhodospirillaceae bacterium]|nr:hypothetical protein [Rhodospirillaceae bacterium]
MQAHAYNLVKKTGAYQIRTHRNGDPGFLDFRFNREGFQHGAFLHLENYREARNKTAYLTNALQLEIG